MCEFIFSHNLFGNLENISVLVFLNYNPFLSKVPKNPKRVGSRIGRELKSDNMGCNRTGRANLSSMLTN